jgi:hypothetical protein
MALVLRKCGIKDPDVLFELIEEHCSDSDREREISDAIENSGAEKLVGRVRAPKWPEPDWLRIDQMVSAENRFGLEQLKRANPTTERFVAEEIVSILFAPGSNGGDPDPFICVGAAKNRFRTERLKWWGAALRRLPLIVPSRMTKRFGLTKRSGLTKLGKISAHCLDNTGPRDYLVLDFDMKCGGWEERLARWARDGITRLDAQAALVRYLAKYGPLVMVVWSGGKSLHAWFAIRGEPEDKLFRFMRGAVALGADPATWTRSQFVRVPEGWRQETKARQEVYYFDPELIAARRSYRYRGRP